MIKVNVFVSNKNWRKHIKKPDDYLKKKIKLLNKKNNFFKNRDISFSLLLSGNKEIKIINKKFRKKNNSTDVLSFPFYEKKKGKKLLKNKSNFYLGDVIVNLNKIVNCSTNKDLIKKFHKLWLHGLLHLLGYRHKSNKDYLRMKRTEDKFLKLIT